MNVRIYAEKLPAEHGVLLTENVKRTSIIRRRDTAQPGNSFLRIPHTKMAVDRFVPTAIGWLYYRLIE